jgi:hypothetical protein
MLSPVLDDVDGEKEEKKEKGNEFVGRKNDFSLREKKVKREENVVYGC